jgi:PAS domain S-box-containing protein
VAFVQDITARKQAEAEILTEREKLKTLSDNAPFGMVLISGDGRFTYINARFAELFGYDLSEIPDGRTWFRKAYPNQEYRDTVISNWKEALGDARPGEQKQGVFTVTCKNGSPKIIQFICSVLASEDYLMTCEDITKVKHLETQLRQMQKMEAIGTLAGGIAHDFNNILTVLIGCATYIQMKMEKESPLYSFVEQILSASRKAADLTKGLLTFSREQAINYLPLNVNHHLQKMEKLLTRLLTEDIELRLNLTQDEVVILSDTSQMDQILFNLVTNARDAMPHGGHLTIETSITKMDDHFIDTHGFGRPGNYGRINVIDSGIGMDEMTREKIFDPFFTTKEVGKGTGLGLATVYGIVKQHDGYIFVESTPEKGTTISTYLPLAGSQATIIPDTVTPIQSGTETILIAEDNPDVMRFISDALQRFGYQVIEAVDGQDAVEKYSRYGNIELIILDSVMPKKNGREVYVEISKLTPQIKVLFTSGYTRDIILEKGIEEGKYDFMAKPLTLNKLMQKVREILDRQ